MEHVQHKTISPVSIQVIHEHADAQNTSIVIENNTKASKNSKKVEFVQIKKNSAEMTRRDANERQARAKAPRQVAQPPRIENPLTVVPVTNVATVPGSSKNKQRTASDTKASSRSHATSSGPTVTSTRNFAIA
jgi:hypothetical protein